jgi:hypothetical protein
VPASGCKSAMTPSSRMYVSQLGAVAGIQDLPGAQAAIFLE